MKYLVLGLGNPGETYAKNRHNVGFQCVDFLADQTDSLQWKADKFTKALVAEFAENTILAKPQTFMNQSGFAAHKLAEKFSIEKSDIIVVHDDLDIRLGEYKIQQGKGPKVHNGISSVESSLRFRDFWRVRIGVDNRQGRPISGEEYVLSNFLPEERAVLLETFPHVSQNLLNMISS